jgi:hypothetical protein
MKLDERVNSSFEHSMYEKVGHFGEFQLFALFKFEKGSK